MKRQSERGFALLLVFLMAAAIAISLYMELPRVAFETQRNRELLLADRAEQYKRAIQLFVRANKRYPSKLEDLETFNDKRYLRHRFIDPLTGKDDWRFVHTNGMTLTDSLVKKNDNPLGGKDDKDKDKDQQASNTPPDPNADPNAPGKGGFNTANIQRPSDLMARQLPQMGSTGGPVPQGADPAQQPGTPQYPPQPGQFPPQYPGQQIPGQPGQPVYPGQPQPGQPYPGQQVYPGQPQPGQPYPGQPPGMPIPGQPVPGQPYPGQPVPGQPYPGQPVPQPYPGQPVPQPYPGQPVPGQPYPGQPVPGQPYPGQPYPGQQVYPGQPQPGQPYPGQPAYPGQPGYPSQPIPGQPFPGNVPPAVQQAIFNPGASRVANYPQTGTAFNNQTGMMGVVTGGAPGSAFNNQPGGGMGAGIAGVGVPADYKGEGILLIKDRSKYREWEFIYDPKEDKNIVGNAAAAQNANPTPANPNPLGGPPPRSNP